MIGFPAVSQASSPPDDRLLPQPRVHPLPPSLDHWQASGGDYFDQIQLTPVQYLVWAEFPLKVFVEPAKPAQDPLARFDRAQEWIEAVTQAVEEWNAYLPLTLVQKPEAADITIWRSPLPIRLPPRDRRSTPSPDGSPIPLEQRIRAAETRYELYERRSQGKPSILAHRMIIRVRPNQPTSYLLATARHELGHALGIWGHSSQPTDALYFSQVRQPAAISPRDINTLKRIYQQPTRLGWPMPP